jgi:hypothetical protein
LLLFLLLLLSSGPVRADIDLQSCPDLEPLRLRLAGDRIEARCLKAVANASRIFTNRSLETQQKCVTRHRREAPEVDPRPQCLVRVVLWTGQANLPADPATAAALADAEAALRERVARACPVPVSEAPYGCSGDAEELASCAIAAQREHIRHALDYQIGDIALRIPVTSTAVSEQALACEERLSHAARYYLRMTTRAMTQCLQRADWGRIPGDPAESCLGRRSVGHWTPPTDQRTAGRLARAERVLQRRIDQSCSTEALAEIDACGEDPQTLAACLSCSHRREAMLLVQDQRGGDPHRATTHFIDWETLRNPILGAEDHMMKNQSVVWKDGLFYVFTGQRYESDHPGPQTRGIWRTPDFMDFELIIEPNLRTYFGDVKEIDGTWHITNNGTGPSGELEVLHASSPDLLTWTPRASITPYLVADPIIDGALARIDGFWFLVFKNRISHLPYVTRSTSTNLDGSWLSPELAVAGGEGFIDGFAEAFHLIEIDSVQRVVGTARDPDPFRCERLVYFTYTCDHETFIYTVPEPVGQLASWTQWRHKRRLRIPFEEWNTVMHANSGHVADWRDHDGFFYASYSGSLEGERFDLRGHGKLGLARSRDLLHWRVPGDLRD